MATVTTAFRAPPDVLAAAEARERLEHFLRAHRVARAQRERLMPALLAAAAERHAHAPESTRAACAIDEATLAIDAWIERIVDDEASESPARHAAHGIAALHLADVPGRWPEAFLAPGEPPAELADALQTAYLEAGPHVALSSMVPRKIELGVVSEVADRTWATFDKWPVLRGLVLWLLFGALLVAAFWLVRF